MNFAINIDVNLLVPGVHQEAIEKPTQKPAAKTACLLKLAWLLNQPLITGFRKKN